MSLRIKLLFLSLMTLILPWAGWQYAQRMETTLRHGQEESLITTADVLSRVVASQPELLYRFPDELREGFDPARGDLFAPLLSTTPLLDGFADEWPIPSRPVAGFDATAGVRLGVFGRYMYAYFETRDADVRYENPTAEFPASEGTTRVVFLTRDEFDRERAWSITAVAPGPAIARTSEVGSPWRTSPDELQHITGVWRATAGGYAVELRVPISMFGEQLAVFALNHDGLASQTPTLGKLHTASDALRERLDQYTPRGLRVSVVDQRGWLLARAGSVEIGGSAEYAALRQDEDGFARSIYRRLFGGRDAVVVPYGLPYGMWGSPVDAARQGENAAIWFEPAGGEPSLVRAAVPVHFGEQVLAALVVEQPAEQLAVVREDALTRLLNLTLLATLFSVVITLAFAARLSQRIRRLSRAVASALTPEGRLEPRIPDTKARDELGTLARSYSTLLSRLKEHTSYLQTLGTKLSHELRTPLTIVSSSLDNLASDESLPPSSQNYLNRARTGTGRLHAILTAMTEANRVEQIIDHTERVEFDLGELVRNVGQAYSATFPQVQLEARIAEGPNPFAGSPDLIAQMLDKLMDNAADFCPPGGKVSLSLDRLPGEYVLSLSNEGPALPPHLDGRLFESLVSARTQPDTKPHLGLGLYIVRLIAESHRGSVSAENLPDGSGVCVSVRLPGI
ncbi:dedicated sortase system histidine kinase [Povalibacter uvarum]|uniref:histidine kinase n=1 Tax=Povalibacter uvarum TaxID=732238 RepID=A0A841HJU6_9GAMM|nr:ATP-binding protein [Povalibacter uvarum]MBB6092570.1 dedicated sortase system histidine kinase [Povalibacter uvarum]